MLQIRTATDANQRATTVKKSGQYTKKCRPLKRRKEQTENTQTNPGNKNSGAKNSIPVVNTNKNNQNSSYKNSNRAERKPRAVYTPRETCGKSNHSHGSATRELTQPIHPLLAQKTERTEWSPIKRQSKSFEGNCTSCNSKFYTKKVTSSLGAAIDSPETTELPPFPEVVWQQPQETHLLNIHENSKFVKLTKVTTCLNWNRKMMWNHKRHQRGKLHHQYPDPVLNRS